MMLGLELRRLELADLDAIERIERASYRAPWSPEDALTELQRVSGTQLDCACVNAFAAAYPECVGLVREICSVKAVPAV